MWIRPPAPARAICRGAVSSHQMWYVSTVTPTWYVLLGPPLPQRFDMTDLATGGQDLVEAAVDERLEPLTD